MPYFIALWALGVSTFLFLIQIEINREMPELKGKMWTLNDLKDNTAIYTRVKKRCL